MGSTCSRSTVQDNTLHQKKVVIAGATFAGMVLAEKLWNNPLFEVLIVDKNDYFEYKPTSGRLVVDDAHIDDITLSFRQIMKAHSDRVTFL